MIIFLLFVIIVIELIREAEGVSHGSGKATVIMLGGRVCGERVHTATATLHERGLGQEVYVGGIVFFLFEAVLALLLKLEVVPIFPPIRGVFFRSRLTPHLRVAIPSGTLIILRLLRALEEVLALTHYLSQLRWH
jgi:hypothetical protein